MQSRILMQRSKLTESSILARIRIAAILFLSIFPVLGFVGTARAAGGIPWQVGDVVVCYGGGNCNVLRIHGNSVQLLDTLSDALLGTTGGAALNNSLHLLATDNGGGGQSKVVVYSIASINPLTGTPLTHSVISTFDASGGTGSSNAQAVALNSAGHIFVGNAGNGGSPSPSIVELDAHGAPTGHVFTFPTTNDPCATTTLGSLDISANGDAIYVTAKDGVIRKVSLTLPLSPTSSCSQFANFGSGVTLYGVKDIPPGALPATCGAAACPSDETVLVVARGFTDPDASETEPPSSSDPDAVNICTNVVDGTPVSCALLLDTNPNPGLTSPLWQAGNLYPNLNATILDPVLHLQRVFTTGTSGGQEPTFSETGGTVIDNAVIWTDQGQPAWVADKPYAPAPFPGTYIVDSNLNLQTVKAPGTSGHAQPSPWSTSGTMPTVDGLQWTDQGQSLWAPNTHYFNLGTFISDPQTHAQKVIQAGTSALTGTQPVAMWNDAGGNTVEGVTWAESHPMWTGVSPYASGAIILDNNNDVQQVKQAGTSASGVTPPTFNEGGTTNDNTVTWTDEGKRFWQANSVYAQNTPIVDVAGHVQAATQNGSGTSGPTLPKFSDTSGAAISDGLIWTDLGQPLSGGWHAGTPFYAQQIIADTSILQHYQQVAVGGTSGSSTPNFNTSGGYTLDQGFLNPPPAPTTGTSGTAVSVPFYVVVTYVNQFGETLPSKEATQAVPSDGQLIVMSPPASGTGGGVATGYNVYVSNDATGGSGAETKQTATPIAIGTNWQEPSSGLVSGSAVPSSNTASAPVVWLDLGPVALWKATTAYPLNAVVNDLSGHVQQATQAGTSGSGGQPSPAWNECTLQTSQPGLDTCSNAVITPDNVVLWTDEGPIGSTFTWKGGTNYASGAMLVDTLHHVQEATQVGSGTSSPSPAPWTFVDGGTVPDNTVIWTDEGLEFWQASTVYTQNMIFVDAAGHVQAATQTGSGTSGPTQPTFSDLGGPAIPDGLIWTDQGASSGPWAASQSYSLNQIMLDTNAPQHFQQVVVAGTSGAGSSPTFNASGGVTLDNSVVWLDLGQNVSWKPITSYPLNAVVTDSSGHVQRATQAGTSGAGAQPAPAWNDCTLLLPSNTCSSPVSTQDNVVLWTDEGTVGSNPAFSWQANTSYANGAMIADGANHVQEATQSGPGMSGSGAPPNFVDGGTVTDGLIWTALGQPAWQKNNQYIVTPAPGTFIVDTHNNLETVFAGGISGPGTPNWQLQGMTIDGLMWADQGAWTPHTQYFSVGAAVGDGIGHVHTVLTTGTSGAGPTTPAGGWIEGGTTPDNAVIWTESNPQWAANHRYTAGNPDTLILDNNNNVELAANNAQWTGTGISGPSQPSPAGNNPWSRTPGGQTFDGLQWSNQATPATSVVARYPVAGVNTLQSLALDPLVANCASNSCSALPLPARKIANFWLGDSGSGSFYGLNFATGTPSLFTGGCPTGCGIESLVIYGGEGSNQPGLASLVSSGTTLSSPLFTATGQFLQNTITTTLSNNGSGSPSTTPISLYASVVDPASCFNDPLAGNLACKATVSGETTKALVWKLDVPLNGMAALPLTEALNTSFASVGGFGIDNSTDVFVDEQFDDTTFVGTDPGTHTVSVHSLHEVPVTFPQSTAQCKYTSPLQNGCYRTGRDELNFTFKCPGLTPTRFRSMHPTLSLVRKNPQQSPQFIPVAEPGETPAYRFDDDPNRWTFDWDMGDAGAPAPGTYQGTTFDSTRVQSFTVTFFLKKSCP